MRVRGLLWFLAGTTGAIFLAVQSSTVWLPWIAENLIVEDQLRSSDLIAVFAADQDRAKHAARLYREGLAPRVLATGGVITKGVELFCHKRVTGAEFMAKMVNETGVPPSAITALSRGTSTYEEGEAIKDFMRTHGYRSVIAVSSPYHMRRVRATLAHLFQGTAIAIRYSPAADDSDFNAKEWWRHEKNLIRVTNEYLKLAYYHLALF
ncbi:MAG: YdcF family protein [Candidatus Binatia bacterium]